MFAYGLLRLREMFWGVYIEVYCGAIEVLLTRVLGMIMCEDFGGCGFCFIF